MKYLVAGNEDIIGPWVCALAGGEWTPKRGSTLGLVDEKGLLQVGIIYEDFNGVNIQCHIAALPTAKNWGRQFLFTMLHYPFMQLECKRITVVVAASNLACRRFVEHLGFFLEATLQDAHPMGDLLIYCLMAQTAFQRMEQFNGKADRRCGRSEPSEPGGDARTDVGGGAAGFSITANPTLQ